MRRRTVALVGVVLAAGSLAACGDDSSLAGATSAAPTTTSAAATTAAAATTVATAAPTTGAATTPATTKAASSSAAPTTAPASAAASKVEVTLKEWSIEAPATIKAGAVEFLVKNAGTANHELDIIKGDSYAALPKSDSGAVLEDKLPAGALVPVVGRFAANTSATGTVTLSPGKYVLVCNIAFGANSHAGKGQRLDVTVTA
jgi:hypothetical protein